MAAPAGFKLRLEPQDEYTHTPDAASNYNESMYFNVFDPARKIGGWFRLGNRPNEGHAEMTTCLYLPDGRVAFMYGKPKIADNKAMNAGGMRIEVIEPFKRLRVTYEGKALVLARPFDMAEPSKAFRENPTVPCKVELDYEGVSPMFGGETVREDGQPIAIDPEKSFAKAHYEQHMAAKGTFTLGDETFAVDGFGLRDKSWGPRYWQAINWYRWCPMNFGRDFGMMLSIVAGTEGKPRQGGMVFKDGKYDLDQGMRDRQRLGRELVPAPALRAKIKTESGERRMRSPAKRSVQLIPLRNRRTTPDGAELNTRITEGMTEYTCNGLTGYGLSDYLDQIVDGKPTGLGK